MTPTYDETLAFIKEAHEGQTTKDGNPYYLHPVEVGQNVRSLQVRFGPLPGVEDDHPVLAALLHDVIEDTDHTAESLLAFGFPPEVVEMVEIVSRDKSKGTYAEFIQSIADSGNLGAMRVKYADLQHNSDPARIAQLPVEMRTIKKRYDKAKLVLGDALKAARR